MTMSRTNSGELLTPAQVAELLVDPVAHLSVAAQVGRWVPIGTSAFRIPRVTADPSAAWVAEGEEIPASDAELDEITVTPSKVAGLTIITQELADDSSPEAAEEVGNGLARDIARRVDQAFFGNLAAPAPKGLGGLTGFTALSVGTGSPVDAFVAATFAAEGVNAELGAFVANPSDALALAQVKEGTGSAKNLLQPDPTQAGRRMLSGVPLLTSPYVAAGTVWGIPLDRAYVVVRQDAEIKADSSIYFTSDRVAVRGIMRVGFGFPHAAAVIKVSLA